MSDRWPDPPTPGTIRDLIHNTAATRCTVVSDECPDWLLADRLWHVWADHGPEAMIVALTAACEDPDPGVVRPDPMKPERPAVRRRPFRDLAVADDAPAPPRRGDYWTIVTRPQRSMWRSRRWVAEVPGPRGPGIFQSARRFRGPTEAAVLAAARAWCDMRDRAVAEAVTYKYADRSDVDPGLPDATDGPVGNPSVSR